jgi:hypothetical protein
MSDPLDIYREQVGGRVGFGSHSAVLVVDFFDMGAKYADVVGSADVLRYLEGLRA